MQADRAQELRRARRDAGVPERPGRDPLDRRRRGRPADLSSPAGAGPTTSSRSRGPTAARRRTSSTTSAAGSRSAWTTAPRSSPGPATSPRCRAATTPGSSATSPWWSSTGTAPATTPRRAEVAPGQDEEEAMQRGDGYVIAGRRGARADRQLVAGAPLARLPAFGVNLVDIPPGESIPEHDETERDQEELFFVISGSPDAGDRRRGASCSGGHVRARRPRAPPYRPQRRLGALLVLIVSAPTTSGYTPMDWA